MIKQTDSHGGKETFGHVSYDDTDQEHDGFQRSVLQDPGYDEEGNSQEDGHTFVG